MTEERMALIELVERQADGALVRELPAFAAEQIMEAEIEARTRPPEGAWPELWPTRRPGSAPRSRRC